MITLEEKRPVGRPATGETPIRHVRISDDLWGAIARWQRRMLDRPKLTTSDAMRELIVLALMKEGIIKKGDALWLES